MSNIANKNTTFGNQYNITIANGTEQEIQNLKNISITNSLIISIPQNNNIDIPEEASLWMTDNDGNLYELARPISFINDAVSSVINEHIENLDSTIMNKINQKLAERINTIYAELDTNVGNKVSELVNENFDIFITQKINDILDQRLNPSNNENE